MAIQNLIKTAFTKAFNKYLYDEMIIGKLAHTEFKTVIKKGDEVDVLMPGSVNMFDYDGGELQSAEKVTTSLAKVRIDEGAAVHFSLTAIEEEYLKGASEEKQAELVKQYTNDAVKKFAAKVDSAYGKLYTRAGLYLDNSGSAITVSGTNARDILAAMQAKFKRGDGNGHNAWVDGEMVCIIPPEYQFYLGKLDELKYVESGHKQIAKGYVGHLSGWEILVSNNIAVSGTGENACYYPLFGRKSRTLAGGISKDLNMQHYVPEKSFDTNYKGYGLFGVGAPRSDIFGTAKIKANISVS